MGFDRGKQHFSGRPKGGSREAGHSLQAGLSLGLLGLDEVWLLNRRTSCIRKAHCLSPTSVIPGHAGSSSARPSLRFSPKRFRAVARLGCGERVLIWPRPAAWIQRFGRLAKAEAEPLPHGL